MDNTTTREKPKTNMVVAKLRKKITAAFITAGFAAMEQTAGIKFTHQHFRPAGGTRYTDSRQIWQSQGARRSAWSCEMSRHSVHGCERGPKKFKISTVCKESPAGAKLLTDLYNC